VNRGKASLFILDSGAPMNLIDTNFARETTFVAHDNETTVRGVQGKLAAVSRAKTANLQFANFSQDNSEIVAIDMEKLSDEMGVAIQGILGMPILWQLKVTIDYVDGTIRFDHPR
jgi:Aspartyl protease